MIRNQNKQDNQYFLLMHVESKLSKNPGALSTPEGSEQQQSGQYIPRGNSQGPPYSDLCILNTEVGRPRET